MWMSVVYRDVQRAFNAKDFIRIKSSLLQAALKDSHTVTSMRHG
jgi:hypothetical protein